MKKLFLTMCFSLGIAGSTFAGIDIEAEISVAGGDATIPYTVDTVNGILTINPAYELVSGDHKDYSKPVSLKPVGGGLYNWSSPAGASWSKSIQTIIVNCDLDTIGKKAFVDYPSVNTLIFTPKVKNLKMIHEFSFLTLEEAGFSSSADASNLESVFFMGQKEPPVFGDNDYTTLRFRDSLATFWKPANIVNVYVPGDVSGDKGGMMSTAPIDLYKATYCWKESEYFTIISLPGSLIKQEETISGEGTVDVTWYPVETATEYHLSIKDDNLVTLLDTVIKANGTTGEIVMSVPQSAPARVRKIRMGDQIVITIVITTTSSGLDGMASATATVHGLNPEGTYRVTLESYAASEKPGGENKLITTSSVDYGDFDKDPTSVGVSTITIPAGVMYDLMGRPANGGHGIRIYRSGDTVKKILL